MKKLIAIFLALALVLALAACGDTPDETDAYEEDVPAAETEVDAPQEETEPTVSAEQGSWSIYWYLCGSDLESQNGCATADLSELLEVQLPENVNVVIETGGASAWQNEVVDAGKLQRYLYSSEGLQLIDEQPSASMGEAQTLADFLAFASTNYPADNTAVVFWNHGGGSVSGAAFDELYDNDSLTLDELYAAFTSVYTPSTELPPIDLIGFDTCLMATVDVANIFTDLAHYLVASEEVEPGNGWYYTQWVGALAEDPYMDAEELGRQICDAFYAGCEAVGTEQNVTLSLTDLTKVAPLLEAYDTFGKECLVNACEDPAFFSLFARAAIRSENYGGNTRDEGYTNMVDLGDLARQASSMTAASGAVFDALDECIVYQVRGPYRANASGLSCYYSYNGDLDDFYGYAALGAGAGFKYYYSYGLTGELDEDGREYIADLDLSELPAIENLTTTGWDGAPLDVDENGNAYLSLGPDANSILADIAFQLYYIDAESDTMLLLGTDNDITADWETGTFYDNFRGVWGAIDGSLVYMELSGAEEDYNLYSVPVLLNGEAYNLLVVYDFTTEQWSILGARQGIDESGMADKELRLLQEGDEITTIWKMASMSGDDDFEMYTADTLTVTADTAFGEAALPDGVYAMMFEMRDAMGNYACSAAAQFTCEGGEIYTSVGE